MNKTTLNKTTYGEWMDDIRMDKVKEKKNTEESFLKSNIFFISYIWKKTD